VSKNSISGFLAIAKGANLRYYDVKYHQSGDEMFISKV